MYSKIINVVDTETTGFSPPPNGDIVEIAVTRLRIEFDDDHNVQNILIGKTMSALANPGLPIHWEAMAVHHITPKMVENARPASEVRAEVAALECDYWAAHNVAFDQKFFTPKTGRWLCTLKASQAIYPNAPSHKNQVLRYWLGLDKQFDLNRVGDTHRAGFDTYVTAHLLGRLILQNKMSLDDMADLCSKPYLIGNIPFGKHRGVPWSQAPKSYLSWLAANTQDEQIKATCKHYMK